VRIRKGKPSRAVIAKAEISFETVHVFETGIITPVLVSAPNELTGATTMQTSLLELPIEHREIAVPEGYDGSNIRLIGNEERP
jgi:hypothetical protein